MPHRIEPASSGRAKCRTCGQAIGKGDLRFGEARANPFGEGEAHSWFHLTCAALSRPEPLLQALAEPPTLELPRRDWLRLTAEYGVAHRRLPRLVGADHAPSGRAQCRHCRNLIDKGDWRLSLQIFAEDRLQPAGFIHPGCAPAYFETTELAVIMERLCMLAPGLTEPERAELTGLLGSAAAPPSPPAPPGTGGKATP